MKNQPIEIFLEELQHQNVRIWLEGDRLRYKAPKQSINPEFLEQLRDRKAEIIAALASQLNYWKQQLGGELPILNLPTDFPRPPVQTHRGFKQSLKLSQTLTTNLKRLSQQQDTTLFMTLLAAFNTLLYRYSGQEDIIVGSPIAGRNRPEIESQICFFVNTLALRTNLAGNPSFLELLDRVRETTLSAYEHQNLPFEKLVEELKVERHLSRSPLFQVMFALQNTPRSRVEFLGLERTPIEIGTEFSKFDLTFNLRETSDGIIGLLGYSTDLFKADTITRMLEHFHVLLEGIVTNPSQPIGQLPLLTEAERHQILEVWNQTEVEYPQDKCLHQLFEEQVEQTPDAIALVYDRQILTYRELNNQANQLAHHLQKVGVKPDVLVGLCIGRSLEMVIGLLGILKAGGAYVPLDPAYPPDRLAWILEDTQVSIVVTNTASSQDLPPCVPHIVDLDRDRSKIAGNNPRNPVSLVQPNHLVYVIYTSGSTGQPKGVMVEHRGVVNAIAFRTSQQLNKCDLAIVPIVSSIAFDGSIGQLFAPLTVGGKAILLDRPTDLLNCIEESQGTLGIGIPSILLAMLRDRPLPASVQTVLTGAEAIPPELVKKLSSFSHLSKIINSYGPTEASIFATASLLWNRSSDFIDYFHLEPDKQNADSPNDRAKITIGKPIQNVCIYLLDRFLQLVPIGVSGEIYIGGIGLARGYLNAPELTNEKFIPNPFGAGRLYKTGDLARYLPDGNIEFLGRIDHQVKIRGFRIELGEIEAVLSQHPQVEEVVVIAREDRPGDKYLAAYIVPNQKSVPSPDDLRQFLRDKLPDYMIPAAFVPLEALPLNPNGKIDRKSLPAPDWQQQTPTSFVAPRNSIEQQLAEIWAKVLWREQPVGIHDNFFDLGGNSLLAVRLVAEIENSLKTKLPLAAFFQLNTVAELAELFAESKPETENLEQETDSSEEVEKADDIRRFLPLDPEIHHQLLALTAGWKGQRVTPDSLIFGLNTQGTLLPLFWCFQGYREFSQLAKYIGAEQPVYGMRSGHLVMTYSQENIQALAAHYVREILRIQPEGSYRLGGNCQAARIIFEIAQQLQKQGKTVAILCLLEAFIPKPYFGEVALFFGRESDRFNPYKAFAEPELGYRKFYRGGFSINIVSGDHGQYFNEPNVQVLTEKLRETLKRVKTDECAILSQEAYRAQILTIPLLTAQTGETRLFAVTVRNISSVTWLATEKSGIFLANHWVNEKGEIVRWLDSRVPLDRDLPPNASIDLEITVNAPKETGQYGLELDLVEEGIAWFKSKGSQTVTVQVEVTASVGKTEKLDRIEKEANTPLGDLKEINESSDSTTIVEVPIAENTKYRQLGDDRFEKGDFFSAINFYQKAIDCDLNQPFELYFKLGKALSETGKTSEAIADYQKVIQLKPDFPDVYWNLGKVQHQQGDLEKAITSYQTALQLAPNLIWLYPILGQFLVQHGQIEAAIANYQKAIEFDRERPELYFNLGNLLFQKGETAEAIEHYRKAIELNLEGVGGYIRLGNALTQQENFEEAIAVYQQAISLNPDNSYTYQMLGNALKKQGELEGAIDSYHRALKLTPQQPFAIYKNLGDSFNQVGKKKEAIASYQKACECQPENPGIYRILGNILCETGNQEGAIVNYQQAIVLNPQQPFGIYKKLGDLLCQQDKIEAAIVAYQKAIELQPKNPAVRKALEKLESGKRIS